MVKFKTVKESELYQGKILGFGTFGTVYQGVWIPDHTITRFGNSAKIPVAIKRLQKNDPETGSAHNEYKKILDGVYLMTSLEHQHLVKILAIRISTLNLLLITPLMPLGNLLNYVRKNQESIDSKHLFTWSTQIALGMAYLEEKGLVHGNLAARNVLVQNPNCVQITDFGLGENNTLNSKPIQWLAMECIQDKIFTLKSDVWAFGVTVWELLTFGMKPYDGHLPQDIPNILERGERLCQPAICNIELYFILVKCWVMEPESRPTFKDLVEEFCWMAQDPGRFLVIQ